MWNASSTRRGSAARRYAKVENEELVRNWQAAIIRDCTRILGRELTPPESAFITRRAGFIALEMIEDEVRSLIGKPDELQRYLRSEAEAIK
jgi:hypothetical protein